MYISYNLFVEALSEYNIEDYTTNKEKHFLQVDIIMDDSQKLYATHLYVCPLSIALKLSALYPFCTFVALRDRFKRDGETPQALANIIVVNEDIPLSVLYNRLNDIHAKLSRWRVQMADAIIQDRPLEELLSYSEEIIGNFISISDSTLSLIAYTRNIKPSDKLSENLVRNGFHDEYAVNLFKEHNRFELWQKSEGLIYDVNQVTAQCPVVSKNFKYGGTYFTHVVMTCNNVPLTNGLVEKYTILLEYLSVYFDKHHKTQQEGGKMYFSVIRNLLDNTNVRQDILAESAEQLGIPLEGSFRLMVMTPVKSESEPAGIITHEIQDLLPEAKIAVYRQSLLAILISPENDQDGLGIIDNATKKIAPVLKARNFCCGISLRFESLSDIRTAYNQAANAISYGKRLMNTAWRSEFEGPFFKYDTYYIYLLLSEEDNFDLLLSSDIYQKLQMLRKYDKQHGSDNYGLLYLYLTLERHAGNTAQKLFMSRNNVAYRISRIVEMIGLDLNDYLTRIGLLLTYELLNLNNAL